MPTPGGPPIADYEALGGVAIAEKRETFDGHELHEVAYGWQDLAPLLLPHEDSASSD